MEHSSMREICALAKVPSCSNGQQYNCCTSDLFVYNDAKMISKMIGTVALTTAHRDTHHTAFIRTKDRHSQVNAETVAKRFRCGLETAQKTLKATMQRGVRNNALHPLNQRYRVDHLNLNRTRLHDTFYIDTLFSKVKSLGGYTYVQLITNGTFTKIYPMESKTCTNIAAVLISFIDDVGVPDTLTCGLATEQTGKNSDVMKLMRRFNIK
jgi:hypothetical protein